MAEIILTELLFTVLFAFLGSVLALRLKQPPVLGLLLAGALVGPNALNFVSQGSAVNIFAEIGAVLLLFAIGLEFSISKLGSFGIRALMTAITKMAIIFFSAYVATRFLGFDYLTALYLAVILAITSTALMIKILQQKNLASRSEVPLLVATLIIEDVFAVFALTFFSTLHGGTQAAATPFELAMAIFQSIALLGIAYVLLLRVLKPGFERLARFQTGETLPFIALALVGGMSYLASWFGLTPSIGAFLAGSLVASLPNGKLLEKAITPFTLAFSSIFFLSIGMLVNFNYIASAAGIITVLILFNLVFKFVGVSISTYLYGFSSKSAVFSGLAMLSVGEFSLLIAREASVPNAPIDLVALTSVLVFTSALFTSISVGRHDGVHKFLSRLLPRGLKQSGRTLSQVVSKVTEAFEPHGALHIFFVRKMQEASLTIGGIAVLLAFLVLSRSFLAGMRVDLFGMQTSAFLLATVAVFALLLLPIASLFKSFFTILNKTNHYLSPLSRNRVAGDLKALLALTFFTLVLPFILSAFNVILEADAIMFLILLSAVVIYVFDLSATLTKAKNAEEYKENVLFFKKR
ncbi:cation:proton antiporter [Candidatus Micrarchaeota archaeon]|nr:cation:proton antiporter [Candidatus Micrarchaeota archaeon]